ncbi:nucleotide pyrophosphohydrolase [Desulfosporosinus sp. SB140]|uniref:nucleotide pyrophosphohydrolase n=1 Tax=Desulfosporosinus paludis TaxID=3115649 RepID=UPI00388D1419
MDKHREWIAKGKPRIGIKFPILNGLTPTKESCTMKVLEEVGELMQLIGKGQGKSGEKEMIDNRKWAVYSIKESLDTAQAAITMAHTLCEEYDIDIGLMMELHEKKLREKGYLV